ncbi:MAG TPA: SDR family oxidoreductase [Chloroflexota bacterium]|nr:SDR family oxidoreductase [Chloroflexota bacterium]
MDAQDPLSLVGKTGLIVGASGSIGSETARLMVSHGAKLVLHHKGDDDKSQIDSVCKTIGVEDLVVVKGDLANGQEVDQLAGRLKHIRFDFVCYASGAAPFVPWHSMTMVVFRHTFEVNVFGPAQLLLHLGGNINDGGAVVVVSSTGAYFGCEDQVDYNASKAALNSLIQSWALALGRRKIRVNGIAPGWVDTPMARSAPRDPRAISKIPLGRAGTPMDVAQIAVFLVSDMNQYASGSVVTVDGGRMANGHGDRVRNGGGER